MDSFAFPSCDEAKAKQGTNPNALPGTQPGTFAPAKKSAFAGQPTVILDGVLKDLANGTRSTDASNNSGNTDHLRPSLNILA
jgi:hypothetical protein